MEKQVCFCWYIFYILKKEKSYYFNDIFPKSLFIINNHQRKIEMRNEYVNISCLEHCVTSANIKDNVLHTDMAESQAEEKEFF